MLPLRSPQSNWATDRLGNLHSLTLHKQTISGYRQSISRHRQSISVLWCYWHLPISHRAVHTVLVWNTLRPLSSSSMANPQEILVPADLPSIPQVHHEGHRSPLVADDSWQLGWTLGKVLDKHTVSRLKKPLFSMSVTPLFLLFLRPNNSHSNI